MYLMHWYLFEKKLARLNTKFDESHSEQLNNNLIDTQQSKNVAENSVLDTLVEEEEQS